MLIYFLNNNGILAKFWSVKYINSTCWLKLMSILRKGFFCCLFNVSLPLCVSDHAFLIKFHASFFWFCTIFSKEDSWFFYFYCLLFHVCGLCVRISVEHIVNASLCCDFKCGSRGGTGGPDPLENHKLYGLQQGISNWTPPPPVEYFGPPLES